MISNYRGGSLRAASNILSSNELQVRRQLSGYGTVKKPAEKVNKEEQYADIVTNL